MSIELKLNTDELVNNLIKSNYLKAMVNPKLPGTFKRGDKFTSKPKYIMIHDTSCLNHTNSALITNSPEVGLGPLKKENIIQSGYSDYNFHYIIDKIGDDYEVISGRPLNVHCDFPDIDESYNDTIHVIILCDLNIDLPDNRMYKVLAYRCLAPLLKMLKIASDPSKAIIFHNEVETKRKDLKCPGDFLAKELLVAQVRRYM